MNKEIILESDVNYIAATALTAGNIQMIYEEGRIRYLSAGGTEIVHMIYPALRDQNWTTIIPKISDEKISKNAHSFSISYHAVYEQEEIKYRADYRIEGSDDGTVTFSMKGQALSRFQKRRIGLCFLHPIASCSGREAEIIQPDLSSYRSSFPELVKPTQPFLNIKGMKWITPDHIYVEVDFDGEIFETEDQRNWSDNSYKTYCTPQSLPAPVTVNAGDKVEQKITIRAHDGKMVHEKKGTIKPTKLPLPKIGYALKSDQGAISPNSPFGKGGEGDLEKGGHDAAHREILHGGFSNQGLLKNIPFDHFSIHLNLKENRKDAWKNIIKTSKTLNTKAELFISFDKLSEEEINSVIKTISSSKEIISSILILSANEDTAPLDFFDKAYKLFKKTLINIPIGYGTTGDFAGLNRNRPDNHEYDFLHFHLQPQIHITDSRSIMENLQSQETLIKSVNHFAKNKPLHISVNFSGTGKDERFHTHFAAWWTLQALRNLASIASVNFHYLTGEEGIINENNSSPVYDVFKSIKDFGAKYIHQHSDSKLVFENASGDLLSFSSKQPDIHQAVN